MREVLDKPPYERSLNDIDTLLNFISNFQAFLKMSIQIRAQLCKVMLLQLLPLAHSFITDDLLLENWIVLINGQVQIQEVKSDRQFDTPSDSDSISTCSGVSGISLPQSFSHNDGTRVLNPGDNFMPKTKKSAVFPQSQSTSFSPLIKYAHKYVLETLVDDCQLLLVPLVDYQKIIALQAQHLSRVEDSSGNVVLLKEQKFLDQSGVACGETILRVSFHLMQCAIKFLI